MVNYDFRISRIHFSLKKDYQKRISKLFFKTIALLKLSMEENNIKGNNSISMQTCSPLQMFHYAWNYFWFVLHVLQVLRTSVCVNQFHRKCLLVSDWRIKLGREVEVEPCIELASNK